MKERPILFSAPMVRAILEGRKTQTRRVLKLDWLRCLDPEDPEDLAKILSQCPYGVPGDRLWVRETWGSADQFYQSHENETPSVVAYRADLAAIQWDAEPPRKIPKYDIEQWNWNAMRWRPSIHMPRWASRLTLEVVSVRVERLHDISEEDAKAEGVEPFPDTSPDEQVIPGPGFNGAVMTNQRHRFAFYVLWDSINGEGSWDANPFVWVVEFKVLGSEGVSRG